jgi:hypothetical protein
MTPTSKRKQDKIEPAEVRGYKLRVMLNRAELDFLDTVRGRYSRAVATRYLITQTMPAQVSAIGAEQWQSLARVSSNLNQISHKLNAGESLGITEIKAELEALRAAIIGAQI